MKIECLSEKISTAIKHVEKVVGKNLSLPVLQTILFEVKGKNLFLRATNLNVGIEVIIPVKSDQEAVFAIKSDVISGTFSLLKKDKIVTLEQEGENVRIKTEHNSSLMKIIPVEDFPSLPRIENGVSFSISLEVLLEGFRSVVYASAFSEIKPEIASVYMYPDNGELVFVATDSFRLAEKKIKVKNLPDFGGVLIPIKNVQDIVKIFSGEKRDVTLTLSENLMSIQAEDLYLTSRLVDGNFPDYRQIIPKEVQTEVIMLTADVMQALRLNDVFADRYRQVDIQIIPQEKKVTFSSKNSDIGENVSVVNAVIKGEEIKTSINQKYISDVLNVFMVDSLVFEFTNPQRPIVLKGLGDKSFLYLIMPMNR